jgi:hypothetical protein
LFSYFGQTRFPGLPHSNEFIDALAVFIAALIFLNFMAQELLPPFI